LVARDRAQVPAEAEIACGSWKGTSRDGSNEQQLSGDLYQHYSNRIEQAVAAVAISGGTWAAVILGGLLGLVIAGSGIGSTPASTAGILIGLLIMAGAGVYFFFQHNNWRTSANVHERLWRRNAMKLSEF